MLVKNLSSWLPFLNNSQSIGTDNISIVPLGLPQTVMLLFMTMLVWCCCMTVEK